MRKQQFVLKHIPISIPNQRTAKACLTSEPISILATNPQPSASRKKVICLSAITQLPALLKAVLGICRRLGERIKTEKRLKNSLCHDRHRTARIRPPRRSPHEPSREWIGCGFFKAGVGAVPLDSVRREKQPGQQTSRL